MDDYISLLLMALSAAFTAWAGVVYWIGQRFLTGLRDANNELRLIRQDLKSEAERLNLYIVQTESRLAVLEDRIHNHKP